MAHNNWTCAPKQDLAIHVRNDRSRSRSYGLPDAENSVSNDLLNIPTATAIESGLESRRS